MDLRAALLEVMPDEARVVTSESARDAHGRDFSYHPVRLPEAVVYPETTAEVAALLRFADTERVPVTPFGAGTSLEGHVIPLQGGISLDLGRMNRVLAIRPEDLSATVQAGVLRSELARAAGEHGLLFPVDPGADASLGGMAATNASGTTTVRYGGMRAQVLALEVVLAGGHVLRTGSRAAKTSAGYNVTGLFVGSEGTLGVITEVTVRLYGIPEHAVALRIAFPDVGAACRTAAALVATGVSATRVELLDGATVAAVNAYKGTAYRPAPSLFVELAGTREGIDADIEAVRELASEEGAAGVEVERDPTGRARLWEARHHVLFALLAGAPGKLHRSTDVCVPVSELAGAVEHAREAVGRHGLEAAVIAHAGDGNYHALFMLDPDDPEELAASERLNSEIVEYALARGGTCSGEHGIGMGKLHYLEREHGDLVPYMRGIKRLFDPNGIMNPGKVVPPLPGTLGSK
jgi:D-lactate dehydrogenase (cytochrome)